MTNKMSAKSSFLKKFVAIAAVLAALANSLLAGDKIQFFSPATQVAVPNLQKEKNDSRQTLAPNLSFERNLSPMLSSPPMVTAPSDSRSRRDREKNPLFGDQKNPRAFDNLTQEPGSQNWNARKSDQAWTPPFSRKNVSASDEGISVKRSGSGLDQAGQSSRPDAKFFNFSLSESRLSSVRDDRRTFSLDDTRIPGADLFREEQLNHLDAFKSLYGNSSLTAPVGSPGNSLNPLHDYTWQSTLAQQHKRDDFLSRKPEDLSPQTFNSRSTLEGGARSSSGLFEAPKVPSLERGLIQGRPAVLASPNRPGELFK